MFSAHRLAAIAIALTCGLGTAEEKRPNLLIIRARSGEANFQNIARQGVTLERCLALGTWEQERAASLSGCDAFRATGGRQFIRPEIPLISEAFRAAGYRTALFGEWGLGENLPFRPEDRGISDLLVVGGGSAGSVSDRWRNSEQNPWLRDRSGWTQREGSLGAILVSESLKWISDRAAAQQPFYLQLDLPPNAGNTAATVLAELKRLDLEQDTITVLMTGPEPGVDPDPTARQKVFIRWPGHLPAGKVIVGRTASFDLFPTIVGFCRVPMFRDWKGDGMDLSKWMLGDESALPERTFFQWAGFPRSESPDRFKSKNFTVLSPRWRLEGLELFDVENQRGVEFEANQKVVSELLTEYGVWWQSVRPALIDPARIIVGDDRQKIVSLTWGDWWPSRESTDAKGQETYPNQAALSKLLETLADPEKSKSLPSISGHWKLHANQTGHYRVTLRKIPAEASEEERTRLGQFLAGAIHVRAGKFEVKTQLLKGATSVSLGVDLNEGPIELEAWTEGQTGEGKILGAFFATVERVGERKMPDPDWKVRPK